MGSREQFDEWYADYEERREANGWMPLEKHVVARMREAWLASRSAIVIELPETPNRGIGYGLFDAGKEQCAAAIEAAGLKVKPC